jgi:hypothetical protein
MQATDVTKLIPILQTAIGPAILISGTGLLLLTMTNRLGRAIDRARLLSREMATAAAPQRAKAAGQLEILWFRARLIRTAIGLAAGSALLAVGLMIVLFLTAWLQIDLAALIVVLFSLCVASLGCSLVVFLWDINQSLAALRVELDVTA